MSAPEKPSADPEAVIQGLEIELQMKRIGWARARERRTLWRIGSFLFLLLVILGAVMAYLYLQPALRTRPAAKPAVSNSYTR
jgi:hypothetical protein